MTEINLSSYAERLAKVRRCFSLLGDNAVRAISYCLDGNEYRFLLQGAGDDLRALFFHFMDLRIVARRLEWERREAPFTEGQQGLLLPRLEWYADYFRHPPTVILPWRMERNARYLEEQQKRIDICFAMLDEQEENIARSAPVSRLLAGIREIRRAVWSGNTVWLRHRLTVESDPYLAWMIRCALGDAEVEKPPPATVEVEVEVEVEVGDAVARDQRCKGLEGLAGRCRASRQRALTEFLPWACGHIVEGRLCYFVEACAELFFETPACWLKPGAELAPELLLPLSAWGERAEEALSWQGGMERLGQGGTVRKLAAFVGAAGSEDRLWELEADPFLRVCFRTALAARGSGGAEATARIRALAEAECDRIEEELRLGARLYGLLNETDLDAELVVAISSVTEGELGVVNRSNFAAQPLLVRVAHCRARCRKYGLMALDSCRYSAEDRLEPDEPPPFFELEPYRLLGMLLKFHTDGFQGDEMRVLCRMLLPLHLRKVRETSMLVTTTLEAWLQGASKEALWAALEGCLEETAHRAPSRAAWQACNEAVRQDAAIRESHWTDEVRFPRGFKAARQAAFGEE